ncbi:MAG: 7,8-didemethyl-8-hydroxy-5-deazariboflavin synthase CofG, partial [Nocardioidaceae bacterium]
MDAPVTAQEMRRALKRASRGATLDENEAAVLLAARGDDLDALCTTAARVRDAGLGAAGRPKVVTYSPKVFIPLTRLCRDRCHYCTFVTTPAKLPAAYLSPDEVLDIARKGAELGCKEALFTLGDRPEDRWPAAEQWLDEHGYDSTLDYVRAMAVRVLEETGLLPHLNPGVMSWEEINRLKPVAPSMGMMLETTSTRLFTEKGQAHFGSPDKDPAVRLRVLEDAGRLNVPFTTGILVGIGETRQERAESVFALRRVARQYGHVQEVIVQNFRAKPDTAMRSADDLGLEEYLAAIAVTRLVMGPKMRVQAPPNLVDLSECTALLGAGVDDWGGVSPLTPDHVNPERPWPSVGRLRQVTAASGFELAERLTVHPEYVRTGEPWIDPRVSNHVAALGSSTGLAAPGVRPSGLPWQEPDGGFASRASTGRTDLHTAIDTTGRTSDRRDDFDDVYGDWDALAAQVAGGARGGAQAAEDGQAEAAEDGRSAVGVGAVDGAGRRARNERGWMDPAPTARRSAAAAGARSAAAAGAALLAPDTKAALGAAENDPRSLTDEQALTLMTADGEALREVCRIADELRRDVVGDTVTYVVNRNINFTNVCYTGCRFCAFAQRRTDADAYSLSLDEVADRAEEAW